MRVRRFLAAAIVASMAPTLTVAQSIRGTVVDSVSGKPVPKARVGIYSTALEAVADSLGRFVFSDVPAGDRALTIHTASLDSLNASYTVPVLVSGATTTVSVRVPSALQLAAMACGGRGYGQGGVVLGKLKVAGDSTAALSGTVSAEWPTAGATSKSISSTVDAHGRFALCGVPLETALSLRASTDGASGQATGFRVSSAARFARAELVLRAEAATMAAFTGFVTDSLNRPIGGAEVSMPALAKTTLTNEEGAFALHDIPPGDQRVVIRRLGYGPADTKLAFQAGRTLQRRVTLTRATVLDSVTVTEKAYDPVLGDFEDNRRLGLGHFITREELAKLEGVSTGSVLRSVPGTSVVGRGPYGFIVSARAQTMLTSITRQGHQSLGSGDPLKGAPAGLCYSAVYVDNLRMYAGRPVGNQAEPPFDINSIPVAEIEAIEYYASVSQMPAKYLTLGSVCGVLVIHTIRFHPKDTTTAGGKPPR
jgi:hypothetical protein